MKLFVLVSLPALVVTVIGPLVAFVGTATLTSVAEITVPLVGDAPVKVTVVELVTKFAPEMEITVGDAPLTGVKP